MKIKSYRNIIFILLLLFFQFSFAKSPVTIGGKVFTEQSILVDLLAQLLEDHQIAVIKKKNLGGTLVAFEALKKNDLDIYVEYSGTSYHSIFKQKDILSQEETFNFLKKEFSKNNIYSFPSLGFSNSYALVSKINNPYNQISDLKIDSKKYSIAFEHELLTRPDGFPEFSKTYDLEFKKVSSMNVGLMYQAVHQGQVDFGIGYTTDGRNKAFEMKIIKDDLRFFPQYFASILVHEKALKAYPELKKILSGLNNKISAEEMTEMNYLVDVKKMSPLKVTRNFLQKKKLIKSSENNLDIMSENYLIKNSALLFSKLKEHLYICIYALLFTFFFGFIFGIAAYWNQRIKQFVFILVNIFQTVPSLALFGFLIPFLGIGFKPSLIALVMYALLPLVHNVYTGLSEVDKDIIQSFKAIGMNRWQILTKIQIPMALPTLSAGLRTSTVIIIGTATIAAFIGAGGLGELIFQGISSMDHRLILLGAIPAALLALIADFLIYSLCRFLTSQGIKNRQLTP